MSHVFPRNSNNLPPVGVTGDGVYLTDANGKSYLDGSGGAAVSCLGHGDKDVIDAIKTQLDSMAFAHTGFLSSQPAEALADLLIGHAPASIDRVYFVSGGSEAVEAALKLASPNDLRSLHASKAIMAIRWVLWRSVAMNGAAHSSPHC